MKVRSIGLAFVALVVSTGLACAADGFHQLKGREITSRIRGMEFTDEVHFAEVFKPNGTLALISMGIRKAGKWRVSGDELCLSHPGDEERCYQIWISGRSLQLRQPGIEITEEGILQKP